MALFSGVIGAVLACAFGGYAVLLIIRSVREAFRG